MSVVQAGEINGGVHYHQPSIRSLVLASMISVVIGIVTLVGFAGFIDPGLFNEKAVNNNETAPPHPKAVFDTAKVEQGVTGVLTNDYKLKASDVRCPDNQPVKTDTTFECTVTVDSTPKDVEITVKSDDGRYEVGQPL